MHTRFSSSSKPRRVVYTCLFGFSEHFNDFAYERDDRIDYICFTDDPDLRSDFWDVRLTSCGMLDATRASKRIKALPHVFLPGYDWSLYVDNTVRLKRPPRELFELFLAPSASPFVCYRNPWRDCVYDEAEAVLSYEYDDPARVLHQMAFYRHLGYPAKAGLATATIMLRRHHDPALAAVMERWHQQVLCHSLRDQLSLNPVAWFDGFSIGYLGYDFLDFELLEWPVIKDGVRVPRDFDDARYHELNPDVTGNGRKHYLLYGAADHRPYK
jgi:hypothetical protein